MKISIVIPAYNEQDYIANCLQAISLQSDKPDEVIVVNNNSTDNTVKEALKFEFITLINEPKQGLFFSRETGMNLATGDILCRIDADTIIATHWVKEVRKSFKDQTISAMTGPLEYYDMPLPKIAGYIDNKIRKFIASTGYAFLSGSNMAIRKNDWVNIKDDLCNDGELEDIDIALHLIDEGKTPLYNEKMQATISSRRFEDKPKDFFEYIGGHTRTLDKHGKSHYGAAVTEAILAAIYLGIKPLHMAYDPKIKKLSLEYWKTSRTARPDPMKTNTN
jgi:glycosyltransferase involved in cell wall biosynthesis